MPSSLRKRLIFIPCMRGDVGVAPYNDVAITPIVKHQSHNSKIFSKKVEIRLKICYNILVLIKSGGGTGPVKPDNHLA